jgi:hypothetical protein
MEGTHPFAGHYQAKADFIAGMFDKLGKCFRKARSCMSSTFS